MSRATSDSISSKTALSTMSQSSPQKLVELPVVLQAIVSRIPLQPLITTFALVHPQWSIYREAALQATSHLELFIGNQEAIKDKAIFYFPCSRFLVDQRTGQPLHPETGDFYRLRLSTLESSTVNKLIRLMPGISHLTLRLNQVDILIFPELIRLLTGWASTLKSLIFSCEVTPDDWVLLPPFVRQRDQTMYSFMILRLIAAINDHLTVLESLTLDIYEKLFQQPLDGLATWETPPFPMPMLGRLKEFYLFTRDVFADFNVDSLHENISAQSPLEALGIAFLHMHWDEYLRRIPPGCPLASRVVTLPYLEAPWHLQRPIPWAWGPPIVVNPAQTEAYMELQRDLLLAYPNLRIVDLEVDETRPLSAYLGVLSTLKQLQALKLRIQDSRGFDFEALSDIPPTLSMVTVLNLDLRPGHGQHTDLVCPLWASLFPSVQIVMVQHNNLAQFCTICYPDADREFLNQIPKQYEAVMPCLKQLIAPLIVLPSLRKIFYQQNYEHDNTVEFSSTGDFVQTHTEEHIY